MPSAPFTLVRLDATHHDRKAFDCRSAPLNRYLYEQAGQDMRRRVAACFVALATDDRIAGYYTLASASVLLTDLPEDVSKKLPRYPTIPAVRLGRLAIDRAFQGRGLGGALLADALDRATRAEVASWAMVADAKNEAATAFYRHHGFIEFPSSSRKLFLPLAVAEKSK
ncbi:MAG: GNAT family N-acetyltransferase [Proteobacteria bacterium]|nr:GNAT family N-acetyltransferase [Pseudomonadota bacterium]